MPALTASRSAAVGGQHHIDGANGLCQIGMAWLILSVVFLARGTFVGIAAAPSCLMVRECQP